MKLLIILIAFITFDGIGCTAYAGDLLGEIDGLRRLISLQSKGYEASKPREVRDLRTIIREASERYELDPLLIESIIKVESNYNPGAVSPKGAMGLMQLMPATARAIGVQRPFDPYQNILGGSYYYRLQLDRFGDHGRALWAYNCGPKCVDRGFMPNESKKYIRRVAGTYKKLKKEGNRYE